MDIRIVNHRPQTQPRPQGGTAAPADGLTLAASMAFSQDGLRFGTTATGTQPVSPWQPAGDASVAWELPYDPRQVPGTQPPGAVAPLATSQVAELQALTAALARLQAQIEALLAASQPPAPALAAPVSLPAFLAPTPAVAPDAVSAPLPTLSGATPPSQQVPAPAQPPKAGPTAPAAQNRQAGATGNDVFAAARLDRNQPPKVSWYRPHRRNEAPTLRISGNVTSENFWREVALASMNVGMSPRRMASVLQTALPTALAGLGVRLDAAGRDNLARTIRRETSGLPRANPIPPHLHPDTTGLYLDDNPAAVGWRRAAGQTFDRALARG